MIGEPVTVQSGTQRHDAPLSLREQALEVIRQAISSGELDEGRIYSAAGLAKDLGMSLSPVREAMMSLVSEGTIEAIPNRGFQLVPITEDDLEELIRIRVRLSEPAVHHLCDLAVGSGDAETFSGAPISTCLEELRAIGTRAIAAAQNDDSPGFFRHDRDYHRTLLQHGLGPRAAAISLRLRDQSRLSFQAKPGKFYDLQSGQDLVDLAELIAAGDHDRAVTLVTANLYYFKRTITQESASQNP